MSRVSVCGSLGYCTQHDAVIVMTPCIDFFPGDENTRTRAAPYEPARARARRTRRPRGANRLLRKPLNTWTILWAQM